jgi:hypothetical protein
MALFRMALLPMALPTLTDVSRARMPSSLVVLGKEYHLFTEILHMYHGFFMVVLLMATIVLSKNALYYHSLESDDVVNHRALLRIHVMCKCAFGPRR